MSWVYLQGPEDRVSLVCPMYVAQSSRVKNSPTCYNIHIGPFSPGMCWVFLYSFLLDPLCIVTPDLCRGLQQFPSSTLTLNRTPTPAPTPTPIPALLTFKAHSFFKNHRFEAATWNVLCAGAVLRASSPTRSGWTRSCYVT